MPRKENPGPLSAQQQQDLVSEGIDNFELPKSLVTKIAKSAVPDNTKLQKEAILSLVKGSTVFINYLAATAHDVAQSKQHKSISASDVLKALELIELGDLVDPLSAELQVYRDQIKGGSASTSAAARRASTASTSQGPAVAGPIIVNGKPTTSSTSNSKNKGKEKERTVPPNSAGISNLPTSTHTSIKPTETLPPPFTSAPLIYHGHGLGAHSLAPNTSATADSLTAAITRVADVDDDSMEVDDVPATNVEKGGEDGQDIELVDDIEVEEEPEEQEPEEEEELQDIVAVEAQELQEDALSVEQRGGRTEFKV